MQGDIVRPGQTEYEWEEWSETPDGEIINREYHGKSSMLRVCADGGVEDSSKADPDYNATTSYNKIPAAADKIPYIVIPKSTPGYGGMLGCVGVIIDHSKEPPNNVVYGIVADVGPTHLDKDGEVPNTLGEVSIKAVHDLGYTDATPSSGPESGDFEIIVFPDSEIDRTEGIGEFDGEVGGRDIPSGESGWTDAQYEALAERIKREGMKYYL